MRRKQRREAINRRFRRMFLVALLMGGFIGFLIGRITAHAIENTAVIPTAKPTQTLSAVIPEVEPVKPVEPDPTPTQTPTKELLGTYRITAYCACEKCCGEWAKNRPNGIVYGAAGVELKAGVSCASPLPFGTVVEVEGLGEYVVQDRIAKWVIEKYGEQLIDIYFADHEAACEFGLKYLNVYLKGESET